MEYMAAQMDRQIEGAISENERLLDGYVGAIMAEAEAALK